MSGVEDFNYPSFNAAQEAWEDAGWSVINPTRRFEGRVDLPYDVYINHSMLDVMVADVVAVLPGWENSKGAQLEVLYARTVGKPIVAADRPRRSLGDCVRC